MAFAKLEARLRAAERRAVEGLWNVRGQVLDDFIPRDCRKYIRH